MHRQAHVASVTFLCRDGRLFNPFLAESIERSVQADYNRLNFAKFFLLSPFQNFVLKTSFQLLVDEVSFSRNGVNFPATRAARAARYKLILHTHTHTRCPWHAWKLRNELNFGFAVDYSQSGAPVDSAITRLYRRLHKQFGNEAISSFCLGINPNFRRRNLLLPCEDKKMTKRVKENVKLWQNNLCD